MGETMERMTRFEKGTEYILYRQNCDVAERTAICTGINRKVNAIRFDIIGSELESFAKHDTVILKLKTDKTKKSELACDLSFKTYLGIYAIDRKLVIQ